MPAQDRSRPPSATYLLPLPPKRPCVARVAFDFGFFHTKTTLLASSNVSKGRKTLLGFYPSRHRFDASRRSRRNVFHHLDLIRLRDLDRWPNPVIEETPHPQPQSH